MDNTIVAIATPTGNGGIGIIRVSGQKSFEIVDKIFCTKDLRKGEDKHFCYGHIINPVNKKIVDEVLVSYFAMPHSYTAENVVEINCHGGMIVIKEILKLLLENGAMLAEPGEFTKRAFLNGRIDLSQAEAVIDIINSKTNKEAQSSMGQLNGFLSSKIKEIREELLDLMSSIEANIDYPEYDIEQITNKKANDALISICKKMDILSKSFETGKFLKEGITTAIIGKPNAGKSSLLNALLREERAIVTDIEGTTRDTIEEFIDIEGIPIKLIDTAGIRKDGGDIIEKIGIEKAKKIAQNSDLVIAIFDGTKRLDAEDEKILEIINNKKVIILINKIDIDCEDTLKENNKMLSKYNKTIVEISAKEGIGLENLEKEIVRMFNFKEIDFNDEVIVTNVRHQNLIREALLEAENAKKAINDNMPIDIIEINIKNILENLRKNYWRKCRRRYN